jgi:hypothetical protein
MTAFTYERDLDHPVSAEVEQTIRDVLEELLSSQGLEGALVYPGLDHDGDPGAVRAAQVQTCGARHRSRASQPEHPVRAPCALGNRGTPLSAPSLRLSR